MKCPNCNEKHRPASISYQVKYSIENDDPKKPYTICLNCGSVLRWVNHYLYQYFIPTFFITAILLFFGISYFFGEAMSEDIFGLLTLGYVVFVFFGFFYFFPFFMKHELVTNHSITLTINSVRKPGWLVFAGYIILSILVTTLLFIVINLIVINPNQFEGNLWIPIAFVCYFAGILYFAGFILLHYTDRKKITGTTFNFNED